MSTDWNDYPHSTDESIAGALHESARGYEASRAEIDFLRDRFVEIIREAHEASPEVMRSTPGASEFITRLISEGHGVAIATGGWTPSARFKLECCGIKHDSIPSAFACDAHPRAAIIEIARTRAIQMGDHREQDPAVVYVGDGLWDLTAARQLGIGFVGLATGQREVLLREAGANFVFPDFLDQSAFLEALLDSSH
jgi:phosphoglycolate phosphatase-like HAD superfamily hydrolase